MNDKNHVQEGYSRRASELNKTISYISLGMIVAILIVPEQFELEINCYLRWILTIWYLFAGIYFGIVDKFLDLRAWRAEFVRLSNRPDSVSPKKTRTRLWDTMVVLQVLTVVVTVVLYGIEVF